MITRAIEQPFVSCGAIELILVFDGAAINIFINTIQPTIYVQDCMCLKIKNDAYRTHIGTEKHTVFL
jgi:hypothetical protein